MPTPARLEISAIEISARGSANAVRAAARIFSRLRSASARLVGGVGGVGGEGGSGVIGNPSGQAIR